MIKYFEDPQVVGDKEKEKEDLNVQAEDLNVEHA